MDEEHHGSQQQQQQIIDYDNSNNKIPIAIKPYWYIDPSIVYRAMTSPVNIKKSLLSLYDNCFREDEINC